MSKLKEIITTQKAMKHLSRKLQGHRHMLNISKDDDKNIENLKREISTIASVLIKQGVEIKNETPEILVLKFIEVRLDYVANELRKGTTKTFFYLEAGILKPLTNYKVFDKEIMDNPDKVKCYEQLEEFGNEV